MKYLRIHCIDCGAIITFAGKSVDAILKQIDESGWEDFYNDGDIAGRCPKCMKKLDISKKGNEE